MLHRYLDTHIFGIGDRLVFLPTTDSTNTQAMQLALKGAMEGVVVTTDNQTAGKGRLGRQWLDRVGQNVSLSVVLHPKFPLHLLVMMASLAAVEAIQQTCSLTASIKWPNDVLLGERKVVGILIETNHDRRGQLVAIMGIGVNVNGAIAQISTPITHTNLSSLSSSIQEDQNDSNKAVFAQSLGDTPVTQWAQFQAKATTLATECGHSISREIFISHLLHTLEDYYLALQQDVQAPGSLQCGVATRTIYEAWRSRLSTLGRPIQVRQNDAILSGIAEDVNESGELLLRNHLGEQVSITWGDVGYPTQ